MNNNNKKKKTEKKSKANIFISANTVCSCSVVFDRGYGCGKIRLAAET